MIAFDSSAWSNSTEPVTVITSYSIHYTKLYDTDPDAQIDIQAGLPKLRREWQVARGDVEEYDAREVRPEDNGQLGPDRSGGVPAFPSVAKKVLRAKPGANLSQMHYAKQGIITPEMEYVATRENLGLV